MPVFRVTFNYAVEADEVPDLEVHREHPSKDAEIRIVPGTVRTHAYQNLPDRQVNVLVGDSTKGAIEQVIEKHFPAPANSTLLLKSVANADCRQGTNTPMNGGPVYE
jgi:hypothetical protein